MHSSRVHRTLILGIAAGFALASSARADFIAEADFSATQNPNGVWSYGFSETLTSAFSLYADNGSDRGIDFWNASGQSPFLQVFHNGTDAPAIHFDNVVVQPGQLAFHPGPAGQYSVIRFTAPEAGQFLLSSSFLGNLDPEGATTDIHILLNNSSIFSGNVNGSQGASFGTSLTLAVGDTLDFKVGYGANRSFLHDSTGISVRISAVPEPASFALAGIGCLAALGYAGLRRNLLGRSAGRVHASSKGTS